MEFFTVYTKLVQIALLASKDLTTAKMLLPEGLDLIQEMITGLRVQWLSKCASPAFACKPETFRSL